MESYEFEGGKRPRQEQTAENGEKKARDGATVLKELLEEQKKLAPFLTMLPHCAQLLKREIEALQNNEITGPYFASNECLDPNPLEATILNEQDLGNGLVRSSMRVVAPAEKYPGFNFVGRLLGPRGNTLKEIQRDSGCKMVIRGKGSLKLKPGETEEELMKSSQHAHLAEPLHVIVDFEGTYSNKEIAFSRAKNSLKVLLHPPSSDEEDIVKKQQLRELALMNGTFKEHPAERAARMQQLNRGTPLAQTSADWPPRGAASASSTFTDPAVLAYNRGFAMQQAAMTAGAGWNQSWAPASTYDQYSAGGYSAYPPAGGY